MEPDHTKAKNSETNDLDYDHQLDKFFKENNNKQNQLIW